MKEQTFNKWFRTEVGAAFAVGAAVAGAVMFVVSSTYPIKSDLAVLNQQFSDFKNNDLTHIELEITQEQQSISDMQKIQIEQGKQITEILTLLKK